MKLRSWAGIALAVAAGCSSVPRAPEAGFVPAAIQSVNVGGVPVRAEISHRVWQRSQGLMERTALAEEEGMLFVYPREDFRSFWMMNTLIGLDIAFFDGAGRFLNVVSMDPYPDPTVDSGGRARSDGQARFVLEVRKGWFRRKGLVDDAGRPTRDPWLDLPEAVRRLAEVAE